MDHEKRKSGFDTKHTLFTALIWIILCLLGIFTYSGVLPIIVNIASIVFWMVVVIIWIARYVKFRKHRNDKRE